MVDRDIIIEKAGIIQRCLKRIAETTGMESDRLDDIDVQDITVLNLQRAIQAAIDLAAHIIADEGYGLPESLRDHFVLLVSNKVIPNNLGEKLQAMVGFRNIAVHEYRSIDTDILKGIVNERLVDLESFYKTVLKKWG